GMKSFCTSTTTRRSRSPGLALTCALAVPTCPTSPPATRPAAPARNSRRLKCVMGHLLGAGSIAEAAARRRGRTAAPRALCDNPEPKARIRMTPRRTMPKVQRSQVDTPAAAAKGRPDWVVVVLALLGVGVAGYLTALKLGDNQAFLCRDGSGCDIVQASRYSLLAGVPTALWGAALYLAIAVLAALPRTARRWQAAFMLASGAVAFSLYLTYLSIFVIGATCPYCLASGVVAVALLVVMILRRPRGEGRAAGACQAG